MVGDPRSATSARRGRRLERLEPILLVAIGGFAGSNLRYFVELVVPRTLTATFLVNVLGSFALAALFYDSLSEGAIADRSRLVFGAGFLSSFTTYSTFVVEAVTASAPERALLYVGASYAVGFAAVVAARALVRAEVL